MAISSDFVLPDQPPSGGFANLIALHGDGFTSPSSMYLVQPTDVGDASGTSIKWICRMDPRYVSVVSHMGFIVLGIADRKFRLSVAGREGDVIAVSGDAPAITLSSTLVDFAWSPTPLVDVKIVQWEIENTLAENYTCLATIYNFDKEAMYKVPLSVILASLPRGSTNTRQTG